MKPPVLCVHQMGKVGSTSVFKALRRSFPTREIHQTHKLSNPGVLHGLSRWIDNPKAPHCYFPDNLRSSIELGRRLERQFDEIDWHLVSLIREPVGRNISAFFQNFHRRWIYRLSPETRAICDRVLGEKLATHQPVSDVEMSRLVADLWRIFDTGYRHRLYDDWFDTEMRDVFGLDVLAEPFPTAKGYQIYRRGSVRLVLLRLENLQDAFPAAMEGWLADSPLRDAFAAPLTLEKRANDGSTKRYRDLYRAFLEHVDPRSEIVAGGHASRVARHFYTETELSAFRRRWEPADLDDDEEDAD